MWKSYLKVFIVALYTALVHDLNSCLALSALLVSPRLQGGNKDMLCKKGSQFWKIISQTGTLPSYQSLMSQRDTLPHSREHPAVTHVLTFPNAPKMPSQ